MDFEFSPRSLELQKQLSDFIDTHVVRAEPVHRRQVEESGDPHFHPPVMEDLKAEARQRGLWNLFLPNPKWGAGLSNLDYAPLCELMGRNLLAAEATNCAAPDTGNMEILAEFGTAQQQEEWLLPLLNGEIRSCFAMTEPWVASSDATNLQSRIERDGDDYVVNAHKWWTSGAASARCMRAIGLAEKALELMCERAWVRSPFGKPLAEQGVVQDRIAESRIEIEQARLLTLKAAWLMDTVGNKGARFEIAAIKVVAARLATRVIDRAIQLFGGAGVSDDWPLASMYSHVRTLHLVDGPDEVHKQQIARRELRPYENFRG